MNKMDTDISNFEFENASYQIIKDKNSCDINLKIVSSNMNEFKFKFSKCNDSVLDKKEFDCRIDLIRTNNNNEVIIFIDWQLSFTFSDLKYKFTNFNVFNELALKQSQVGVRFYTGI